MNAQRDLVILSLLHHQPLHGYGVFRTIQENGLPVFQMKRAKVYSILQRLKQKRWIQGQWESGINRRDQFVYSLTKTGKEGFIRHLAQWTRLTMTMDRLLKHAPIKLSSGRILKPETSPPPRRVKSKKTYPIETKTDLLLKFALTKQLPFQKFVKAPN